MQNSLRAIAEEGAGVLVYLHETGPGFRVERDGDGASRGWCRTAANSCTTRAKRAAAIAARERHRRADSLSDLGLHTIRLLTNHPRKIVALEGFGIEIVDQIPIGH